MTSRRRWGIILLVSCEAGEGGVSFWMNRWMFMLLR